MKSFTEFVREINSEEKCIDYLIEKNIFRNVIQYPKCDKAIKLNRETLFFHCLATSYEAKNKTKRKRVRCNYLKSIRTDTWFENVRLQLLTAVTFIAEWLWYPPPRFGVITNDLHIGSHTFVDWSSFCREVCLKWSEDNCTQLGGPNKIVEIDEAKFGKRKYHRGRVLKGKWVFGGYERESKKIFIVAVNDRSAETLLNVIHEWILPGTTIMSDCWKAYNCLNSKGYVHLTVNHSYNFVDPDTNADTQSIERTWRDIRENVSRNGNKEEDLSSYLGEYLFKRRYSLPERIDTFFYDVAKFQHQLHNIDD